MDIRREYSERLRLRQHASVEVQRSSTVDLPGLVIRPQRQQRASTNKQYKSLRHPIMTHTYRHWQSLPNALLKGISSVDDLVNRSVPSPKGVQTSYPRHISLIGSSQPEYVCIPGKYPPRVLESVPVEIHGTASTRSSSARAMPTTHPASLPISIV